MANEEIKKNPEEGELVGKVIHFFSNIGVAVIELSDKLAVGDTIRIIGGENTDFNQLVESMEVERKKITAAKKGDEVGLKVSEKVREGYQVYKV